jgi:hypothetical protein
VLGIQDDEVPGIADPCDCDLPGCATAPAELFAAHNTREDLGRYVEAVFGPRPAVTE